MICKVYLNKLFKIQPGMVAPVIPATWEVEAEGLRFTG
jgi:hypothetical protein